MVPWEMEEVGTGEGLSKGRVGRYVTSRNQDHLGPVGGRSVTLHVLLMRLLLVCPGMGGGRTCIRLHKVDGCSSTGYMPCIYSGCSLKFCAVGTDVDSLLQHWVPSACLPAQGEVWTMANAVNP